MSAYDALKSSLLAEAATLAATMARDVSARYQPGELPELVTVTPRSASGGGGINIGAINVSGVSDPQLASDLVIQKLQDRGMLSRTPLR